MKTDSHTSDVQHILSTVGNRKQDLIAILQAIQKKYNYLPRTALDEVCESTDITSAEIVSVAGFYSQFRLEPVGEHIIKVCVGTACHVKGAGLVHDAFKRHLDIAADHHTSYDNKYTVDKVSCLGCCTLAPVVQIDNITYGHVSSGQIEEILNDFEQKKDRQAEEGQRKEIASETEVRIGLGSCCAASGSEAIRQHIEQHIVANQIQVKLKQVGCVGMCHQVPLVEIVEPGKKNTLYAKVQPDKIPQILDNHFQSDDFWQRVGKRLKKGMELIQNDSNWQSVVSYQLDVREEQVSNFLGKQIPIATENRGELSPVDLQEYVQFGGFQALRRALQLPQEEIIGEIEKSGLRGRGGGGFPTFIKWRLVHQQENDTKYLICNGDEGDPGAFMDRMLLESYPYRVVEGMLIAARAVGATQGFFYIRAEYPLAVSRIAAAIDACRAANLIGENILKSDFSFDIKITEGAGAFVCGEETALIASIEGKRGFPTIRPPYPAESGLFGKPTLVNNTETLAQVPFILKNGSEKFAGIGVDKSKGTKVFALAGKVAKGGLIEVPLGITIREIVEEIGGGVADGKQFKAVQIGGPSGGCIPHYLADTPVDYESLQEIGAMMGSGGLVVLDETDCMVDMARYFLAFTQEESCGKCTFCRVGTRRLLDILDRICTGKGKKSDLDDLEKLCEWVNKGSLCGLGKTAPNPVLTTLKYFRDEYEAHIEGRCPTGKCTELIAYSINDNCIGCTICSQRCPVDAIPFTPHEKHTIDMELCIKCDTCVQVCPEDAVVKA